VIKINENARVDYLGDGVYIQVIEGQVVITTGTHDIAESDSCIYLEDYTMEALLRWINNNIEITQ